MIDIHNHILPDVDDGAKTIKESVSMLKTAIDQGITDVVSTVHYQHPKMEYMNTDYEHLQKKVELLQNEIGSNIKIHLSSEVYFLPNLKEVKKEKFTTFFNDKYMLLEFQSFYLHPNYYDELFNLKLSGTTPIIAHPERSMIFRNNIDILKKLIKMGCILQLNSGSLLGHFGKKCQSFARELLSKNMIHILCSDAHNFKKRNFCLKDGFNIAKKIIGNDAQDLVYLNPGKILKGEQILI